jgi:hypothetical protein
MTKTDGQVVKQFDCIEVKRAVQSQVMAETTGMSTAELLAYFNNGVSTSFDAPIDTTSIKPKDAATLGKLQIVPTGTAGFPSPDFNGTTRTYVSDKTAAGAWSTGQ